MKSRIIIYVSIFGILTTAVLLSVKEIQQGEYTNVRIQQIEDQSKGEPAISLFTYIPVD